MKIILFGANGMLGNYVRSYLSKNFDVVMVTRSQFDIESKDWDKLVSLLNNTISTEDIIINCAGAIPQRHPDPNKYIIVNTLFPLELEKYCMNIGLRMIHITTDCVFSGNSGKYDETSIHDATELYGITKSLGEPKHICVLRTSIIGEENKNKTSLLEWVRANRNQTISGYSNVFWNGVTCLQLAKVIQHILIKNIYWRGVRHIHSPDTVSKYQLCQIMNEVYDLHIRVEPGEANIASDRSIASIYSIRDFEIPSIRDQIMEQSLFPLCEL
jgi:dTDP-4-dehydrorhamnose reductase